MKVDVRGLRLRATWTARYLHQSLTEMDRMTVRRVMELMQDADEIRKLETPPTA